MLRFSVIALACLALAGCAQPIAGNPTAGTNEPMAKPWQLDTQAFDPWNYTVESWLLDDLLVIATDKTVSARSRGTGDKKWSVDVPKVDGAPGRFCGSSREIVNGHIALAFGAAAPRSDCLGVTVVDVKAGRPGWAQQVPSDPRSRTYKGYVEVIGDRVVLVSGTHVNGFRLTDGSGQWTLSFDDCDGLDLAVVFDKPTIIARCNPGKSPLELVVVNPADGKVERRKGLTDAETKTTLLGGSFVATSPLVIKTTSTKDFGSYAVFDTSLSIKSVVHAGQESDPNALNVNSAGVGESGPKPEYHVLVTDELLITPTLPSKGQANHLIAFDMATGAQRWKTSVAGSWLQRAVALEGGVLTVVVTSKFGDNGDHQLMRAEAADGKLQPLRGTTPGAETAGSPQNCRLTWADGRVYAIRWTANRHFSPLFTIG